MTPTIKDVAAHAGFSIATVSRAINAPHTVNPVTLEKVRQSINALDFRPSPLGRQLRGERSRLIGVVLATLANPVFAECLQGIDELASAQGFRLMLMTTQYDSTNILEAIVGVGDFNHDGKLDLVAIDSGGVTLALGNGDGTFATPSTIFGDTVENGGYRWVG